VSKLQPGDRRKSEIRTRSHPNSLRRLGGFLSACQDDRHEFLIGHLRPQPERLSELVVIDRHDTCRGRILEDGCYHAQFQDSRVREAL
jgi:hypothetical protein